MAHNHKQGGPGYPAPTGYPSYVPPHMQQQHADYRYTPGMQPPPPSYNESLNHPVWGQNPPMQQYPHPMYGHHPSAMPPVPNYMPGQPYQQPYMYPNMQPVQRPAGPATYVVPNAFDAGARFDGIAQPTIPPPPPGIHPNAAQQAAASGNNVVLGQKPSNWFTGGSSGGMTFW